jgi:hypothetical protein
MDLFVLFNLNFSEVILHILVFKSTNVRKKFFLVKKKLQPKIFIKYFFPDMGRFIYQNVKNQILRNFQNEFWFP